MSSEANSGFENRALKNWSCGFLGMMSDTQASSHVSRFSISIRLAIRFTKLGLGVLLSVGEWSLQSGRCVVSHLLFGRAPGVGLGGAPTGL